jgi:hypothetical protein
VVFVVLLRADREWGVGALQGTVAAGVLLLAAACGSGDGGDGESAGRGPEPVGTTAESSPFSLTHEPEGYRLVQAGRGGARQVWASDSAPTDEAVTVLAPSGADPGGREAVLVAVTGFDGRLAKASASYVSFGGGEPFEAEGQPAIYTPGGRRVRSDLVMEIGDDVAVRVAAFDTTREELVEVARQVEPRRDDLLAPLVPDPPGDLEVVGSADADVAMTLAGVPLPRSPLPAGARAHTAVWAVGERGTPWSPQAGTVAVSTLPGTALDLGALAHSFHAHRRDPAPRVTAREVGGRPGAVLEREPTGVMGQLRAVATSIPGGDLALVVARGASQPSVDELVAIAASAEPSTRAEWDALIMRSRGGPGLHPDEGAVELSRGTAEGVEWLFQAEVDDVGINNIWNMSPDSLPTGEYAADPCLKVATQDPLCVTSTFVANDDGTVVAATAEPATLDDGRTFPGFLVVSTTLPAATVRVHPVDAEAIDAPLVPVPGGRIRAAAVVTQADLGPVTECPSGRSMGVFELLDRSGQPLPC